MEQRFVVNGINDDKIELVSKYDIRKLNRLMDAKDQMWLAKIEEAKKEIMDNSETLVIYGKDDSTQKYYEVMEVSRILEILDSIIDESEAG